MQDFNPCKTATIGSYQGAVWLKTKLLKHRFAVRIMKLTAFLLLVCMLDTSAKAPAQEKITLKEKGASLINIFTQINKQTGYNFLFTNEDIKLGKPVDIDVKNASLKDVLDILFKKQELIYNISDKIITVQAKKNISPLIKSINTSTDGLNIHGKVVDENGKPVAGVTVTVKGTKKQTITNENGEFNIPGVEMNAVLSFSTVNMEPFEIRVDGKTEVIAKLKTKTSELDEVQIIAYGQTTKRLQTGNVTSVSSEEIQKQPVSNPLLALEGRVPGMFITQNNGVPGGGVTVRIQGQNSIQSGNDPLYVIDGVPYNSQITSTGLGNNILGNSGTYTSGVYTVSGVGNPLNYINPLDIESIEVLKDADATAIYGSRAANGALLITTKKGKAGATKIDINLQQGWGQVTRKMKMLNTRQYLDMRYEALSNDGININTLSPNNNRYYDLMLWDTTRYTDWQKVLIGGTAQYTNINSSISGGTSAAQYIVGGTYHRETTVFPGNFADEKASIHFSINSASSNQKFHLLFSGNYLIDNNRLPQNDLTQNAVLFEPDTPPLYNADGSLNWAPRPSGASTFDKNPMAAIKNTYKNKTNNLISNVLLSYNIFPGLQIKSSFGYTKMQSNEINAYPLAAVQPENRPSSPRVAQYGFRNIYSWIIEPQVNFIKMIGKGKLNILLGTTINQFGNNGFYVSAVGFSDDNMLENINGATSVSAGPGFQSVYKYNAVFSRLNYSWQDKYIINLNARRDGSSRFGEKNRFSNFGSIGGAWVFSQERFLQQSLSLLSFGKLRTSYGITGNDQIGDYAYMNLYRPTYTQLSYQAAPGLEPSSLTNPYLEWEETRKLSIGLDLGLYRDRVLFSATYTCNRSSNELLNYLLPSITGFPNVTKNFPATVQNSSWEFAMNTTNVKTKDFSWLTSINLTLPRNKLIAFPGLDSSSYATSLVIGKPITIQRVFHSLGVDPSSGLYVVSSTHGTPTSTPDNVTDRTALINTLPKFYGGIQNSVRYKGFQLDFLFQFVKQVGQNYFYWNGSRFPGQFFRGLSNQPVSVLNHWQKTGDVDPIQKFSSQLYGFNAVFSDAGYSDASYIRLKNLSLSYELSEKWLSKAHIRSKIYVQGQNLLTITHYQGMDPENQSTVALPPLRVLTVGILVNF